MAHMEETEGPAKTWESHYLVTFYTMACARLPTLDRRNRKAMILPP